MPGMKRKASALVDTTASAEAKASMAADAKTPAKAGTGPKASVAADAKAPAKAGTEAKARARMETGEIGEAYVTAGMADAGRSKAGGGGIESAASGGRGKLECPAGGGRND